MKLTRVTRDSLKSEFQTLEPYFDKFCEKYPEFDKLAMISELVTGESVLWACENAFVIGRPNRYHNKEIFLLECAGGEAPETWLGSISDIEEEVKEWGFDEIEFYGRLGWRAVAREQGYKPCKVVLRKKL